MSVETQPLSRRTLIKAPQFYIKIKRLQSWQKLGCQYETKYLFQFSSLIWFLKVHKNKIYITKKNGAVNLLLLFQNKFLDHAQFKLMSCPVNIAIFFPIGHLPAFVRLVLRLPWPRSTWRALTERRCKDLKNPSGILLVVSSLQQP